MIRYISILTCTSAGPNLSGVTSHKSHHDAVDHISKRLKLDVEEYDKLRECGEVQTGNHECKIEQRTFDKARS